MAERSKFSGSIPFPKFDGKKLFISSSSDMREMRHQAFSSLGALLSQAATDDLIEPYEWETCIAEKPFDQRLTMQENLGRPSDPNCVGTICYLGERIGYPLREFDLSTLLNGDDWADENRDYRLVHTWPVDLQEQLDALQRGGFPLTGTVFEVLDSIATDKPVFVCYFADKPIVPSHKNPCLNGRRWRNMNINQLDEDRASDWMSSEYKIQTKGVINFVLALQERSKYVAVHHTYHEALLESRRFVETQILPPQSLLDNPYRYLDYYDIFDSNVLPGREDKCQKVIKHIQATDADQFVVRVVGESGCGKTSFLRAGILSALVKPNMLGKYRVLAVRPTDFHGENGLPVKKVLSELLKIIDRENTDLNISAADRDAVECGLDQAPSILFERLSKRLEGLSKDSTTLVIGLDQFEEIIDDLVAPETRAWSKSWKPLLNFIDIASKSKHFGFVYTLEKSRIEKAAQLSLPDAIQDAYEVKLGGQDEQFIETVISKPFERAGFGLSAEIVNTLVNAYVDYNARLEGKSSALPLLSLKLSNLFDYVKDLKPKFQPSKERDGINARFDADAKPISIDELEDELDFGKEIEDLANTAWGTPTKDIDGQLQDLNLFLQPLVALSEDFEQLTLQTVSDTPLDHLQERLEAFEKMRLIVRENGRRRLVHEAVVRQWPLALMWLERQKAYLTEEVMMRHKAIAWNMNDRAEQMLDTSEQSIQLAAAALRNNLHEWAYCDEEQLAKSVRILKDYCLEVFSHSTTPELVDDKYFNNSWAHVHLAASYGLTDQLTQFLSSDPECAVIRTKDKGRSPLDCAAWKSKEAVELLVEDYQVDAVSFDNDGWSSISAPVWLNNKEIFGVLFRHYKTAEDIKAPGGMSLLHVAARRGALDIAATLITSISDLDVNAEEELGYTPLDYAAFFDQPEAFCFFLKYCEVTHRSPKTGFTVLHSAAHSGSTKVLEEILKLVEFNPELLNEVDNDGKTALMIAAQNGQHSFVKRLGEYVDPNVQVEGDNKDQGWAAIHYAISGVSGEKNNSRLYRQKTISTVRALLEMTGFDPNLKTAEGKQPISMVENLPQIRSELIYHPNFSSDERLSSGETPLNYLISIKDRAGVERLLSNQNIDIEERNQNGDYIMSLLIKNNMADIAYELLSTKRVSPWSSPAFRGNGVVDAINNKLDDLIELYFDQLPANLETNHIEDLTNAASYSICTGTTDKYLKRLLDAGASCDKMIRFGQTLFHYAAMVGDLDGFKLLMEYSDNTTRPDAWGRIPAQLAPEKGLVAFSALMKDEPDEALMKADDIPRPARKSETAKVGTGAKTVPVFNSQKHRELGLLLARGDIASFTRMLEENDLDPMEKDGWGRTLVDYASDSLQDDVRILLKKAAENQIH